MIYGRNNQAKEISKPKRMFKVGKRRKENVFLENRNL